jgi:dipeptidyl aminopeptidase/acylaminoacyl peptidase
LKPLYFVIIIVSVSLSLIALLQPVHAQNISTEKNATLIVNFNSSEFNGYQGGSFTPSHDGSMYAYSTSIRDPKSGNWKSSLRLYFLKNDTSRSLDLNSNLSQILDISFSPDDKKLLFVGNGCDSNNQSHTTFYVFNLLDIHLKCNGFTNVHSADWMLDGSIVFLQNNEENDTLSIYQNNTQKLLYAKQIAIPFISLNSSHIEFIKASPDGKKIALWYFVMFSHKTQILDVDTGKIIDTFDGGHPRWGKDSDMLLYTFPTSTGYYNNGPRAGITYINLLDVNKNKTSTIDSIPVGVDDLFLSANDSKAFYVTKVQPPYEFLNFTSGIYKIDLNGGTDNTVKQRSLTDMNSPLQQFKSGISAKDVQCKDGLQFIMKKENGQFACVKMKTANELFNRGWGIYPVSIPYH